MTSKKEKNFVSAVMYVHNNKEAVKAFLPKLYKTLSENFNTYEVICVNDCTEDDSVQVIKDFFSQPGNAMVNIVNMSLYQGLELSMNAGIDLSIGDFVFEFDRLEADYDDSLIMDVYWESLKGYDIVAAAPDKMKRKSSRLFYNLYNRYSGSMYKLRSETFRILSRRAINRVHSISSFIPYRKALYANCGLKVNMMLYKEKQRKRSSSSKQIEEKRRDVAADTFILFTSLAYKIALFLSVFLLLVTVASAIYTLATFLNHRPVAGWTTTMLLLSGGFFGVFLLFAIVIKYLNVLVDLVFKHQKYLVESIEKISK